MSGDVGAEVAALRSDVADLLDNYGAAEFFNTTTCRSEFIPERDELLDRLGALVQQRVEAAKAEAWDEIRGRIVGLHPEMLGWCQSCEHETYPCRTLLALDPGPRP